MPRRASAKRYAQAAFYIASAHEKREQWASDLSLMKEALQNEDLRTFLEHAKVPLSQKVWTIGEVFREADPLVQNLLSLLVSRGYVELVPEIEQCYQQLLNEFRGKEEVEVSSAVPLDDTEMERIGRFLASLIQKEVVLASRVDESILGGLVIKVRDQLIDGSTRTRLEELGKRLQRDTARAGV